MLKKFFIIVISFICVLSIGLFNRTSIFSEYSNTFEICFNRASSSESIFSVKKGEFIFLDNVAGESFSTTAQDFNLDNFLNKFNARIVMVEKLENGVSYYAYSPTIKYKAQILDKTVNLQVFVGEKVTVGSPFIFGSF